MGCHGPTLLSNQEEGTVQNIGMTRTHLGGLRLGHTYAGSGQQTDLSRPESMFAAFLYLGRRLCPSFIKYYLRSV
jgi:hypothetical protein